MITLQELESHPVWKYFFELSTIPRPSKHEQRVREWIVSYAKKWNIAYKEDDFGNIVYNVEANDPAYCDTPCVVIQSHLDMVCEKDEEIQHDFFSDPLHLHILHDETNEAWCTARGTTLGADNGIAVAMTLALADPECKNPHGPLQLLFTLDEETGLNGAANLGEDMLNAPYLINIDNSEEGVLCIGCAGGVDFVTQLPIIREAIPPAQDLSPYRLSVRGLSGGHSGTEIYDGRSNAIKIMEWALRTLRYTFSPCMVYEIHGGDKRNAIAHFAHANVLLSQEDFRRAQQCIENFEQEIQTTFPPYDKALTIQVEPVRNLPQFPYPITDASVNAICASIRLCPHGVIQRRGLRSPDSSLSNNLASIRTHEEDVTIMNNSRFSSAYQAQYMEGMFDDIFAHRAQKTEKENPHPAWQPIHNSKLQETFIEVYKKHYKKMPQVQCVHAGLECGLIKARTTQCNLDAISIGPTIEFLHSPQERLNVESTHRTWNLLCDVLISL